MFIIKNNLMSKRDFSEKRNLSAFWFRSQFERATGKDFSGKRIKW